MGLRGEGSWEGGGGCEHGVNFKALHAVLCKDLLVMH